GAIILTYGGYLIIHNNITGGDFASFIIAFFMLNEPIKKLNGFTLKMQEGSAAAGRVYEVLDLDYKISDKPDAIDLPAMKNEIHVKIDRFSYGDCNVLTNIDFKMKSGTITALVGASGSGKSTLANLIPRFYDIAENDGFISIDGNDLRDITMASLRNQIAIVTQEIVLFNDTITNNISYGNINCSKEKIVEASKAAYAYNFIMELNEKFDQEIGEKGVLLSGGQRQRISISRALIKNAPILILDEATSALDTESEMEVQAAIENLMKNRTSLVIAHRLTTVQHADVIHVLKNGRIIESGSHKELLLKEGEYKRLYGMQFKDQ
ncbi:MAG: ATP-binding cassette domain-containing protein, partial [Deltaproteobacteria bacterium]|nr:ATP-binding cassette domain-containing protein [Deltaproteobacteria bacterium]